MPPTIFSFEKAILGCGMVQLVKLLAASPLNSHGGRKEPTPWTLSSDLHMLTKAHTQISTCLKTLCAYISLYLGHEKEIAKTHKSKQKTLTARYGVVTCNPSTWEVEGRRMESSGPGWATALTCGTLCTRH